MMDHMIIITLVLISAFSIVNGQSLQCFVCTNCPYVEDLDDTVSQRCDFVSSPNTPPTATPSPPTASTPSLENVTHVYESLLKAANNDSSSMSDENSDKPTEQPRRSKHFSPYLNTINQLNGIYQCFRISRRVGDRTEVVRGCVVTASNIHETCVQANGGVAPLSCGICDYDDCNTAKRNTTTSIIIMFTSIVTMAILR